MLFISDALASASGAATAPGGIGSFLPLIIICVIFYFLLIRPQQKRMKAHEKLVNELKVNDKVITAGGVYGKITAIEKEQKILTIEIAKETEICVKQDTITALASEEAVEAIFKPKKATAKSKAKTPANATTAKKSTAKKAPAKKATSKAK